MDHPAGRRRSARDLRSWPGHRLLPPASRAALVLSALRAPYRAGSTPVNAGRGSFDLAVSLFSGLVAQPSSDEFVMRNAGDAQQIEVRWWPVQAYPRAAFFAYAYPAPQGFEAAPLSPAAAHWDAGLGEYVLDSDDVRASPDHPRRTRFRPVVGPACVRGLRLESSAVCQCAGRSPADRLIAATYSLTGRS